MQIFKKSNAFKCKLLTHELFLYVNLTNIMFKAALIRKSIQCFISNHFINQNMEQNVWGWYYLQRYHAAYVKRDSEGAQSCHCIRCPDVQAMEVVDGCDQKLDILILTDLC